MQIFQPLDLTFFGIFKQKGKRRFPFDKPPMTISFLCCAHIELAQTLTLPKISVAFDAIGVGYPCLHYASLWPASLVIRRYFYYRSLSSFLLGIFA
jgi:hypothetical protein